MACHRLLVCDLEGSGSGTMPPTWLQPDAEEKPIRAADGTALLCATIVGTKLQLRPWGVSDGPEGSSYIGQVGSEQMKLAAGYTHHSDTRIE
jgi:hypothetical protein